MGNVDAAAKHAIGTTNMNSQDATGLNSDSSWISTREDRYIVTLDQLSSFSCAGKSIDKLINEVKNPGLKTALITLKKVSNKDFDSKEIRSSYYRNFILVLRFAVDKIKDRSSFDFKVATELCSAMFTVDIADTSIGLGFIDHLLGDYHPSTVQEFDATHLELKLREGLSGKTINHKITDLRRKLSASSPTSSWDPALYSTISKIADVQIGNRAVTFIRTACPVLGSNRTPTIDPLFIGMLRDMKAKKKQYLYINNQSADRKSDPRIGESLCESNRVAALKALSESDEFKGSFHVVSFAHDSTFYKAATEVSANELKAEFFTHLHKGEQGYFLPDFFKDKQEKLVEVLKILNEIHTQYFEEKLDLSAKERQEFLHVAYAAISKFIITEMKIDAANITCKDGVDRAAGSFANLVKIAQPNIDPKLLLWSLSFPAVVNPARPPKGHRHVISIASLKRIDRAQLDLEANQ